MPKSPVTFAEMRSCYADIEKTEARLAQSPGMKAGQHVEADVEPLQSAILELLKIGHGTIPSQEATLSVKGGAGVMRRARLLGGLRRIIHCLYPDVDDVFPFYLAILIQTSANPQSLRLLKRSCIEPHAVRTDLERIVWDKPRARSEQSVDFPVGRTWSAPNLVRRMCALNEDLMAAARQGEEHMVFLARGATSAPGAICWQSVHNCLAAFCERHELACFHLKSLRRAGAKLHHAAGQSIRAAKLRLNHASESTTQRYTPTSDRREEHEQTILKFQGVLVRESRVRLRAPPDQTPPQTGAQAKPVTTVFGFECKDPFAGVAPGSESGRMCLQFFRCATCPGALIPVDDILVVAKLLSASEALAQARQRSAREGWTTRFELIYGPVQAVIDQEILPLIDISVAERAGPLVDTKRLPWIE